MNTATDQTNSSTAERPHPAVRALMPGAAALGFAWWLLADGDPASWLVGLPSVAAAVVVLHFVNGRSARLPRPGPALALLPVFLRDSLVGAVQVALRAVSPRSLPPSRVVRWPLGLARGRGRLLYLNLVSLMPGTLSMGDDGSSLSVHVLDGRQDAESALADLEARVAPLHAAPVGPGDV